jgi:hypothetical protein
MKRISWQVSDKAHPEPGDTAMLTKTTIALTAAALVLGTASISFAAENDNGVSIYIPNYASSEVFMQQPAQARARQVAPTLTDSERVWRERSTKDIGSY